MKILIIEDELLIQKSLQRLLTARGAIVSTTASGQEAISLIKEFDYDRVICDLMLKDITGFDIIEDSKSKYTIQEISSLFIIITGYSSEQVLKKAMTYGCQVIKKPFDDLENVLNIFLNKELDEN